MERNFHNQIISDDWLVRKTRLFFLFYWVSTFALFSMSLSSHSKDIFGFFQRVAQFDITWRALFLCCCWVLLKNQSNSMENCHPCSDFYCIQHPFNVGVRVFCALVLSSSSSHCDRALFIARVSIYVISDMYTVRAFSLSSRMIFWCFLYTIKVGLIQCLFTHSRSRAFLSCVSNAGNFSFRACTNIHTHSTRSTDLFVGFKMGFSYSYNWKWNVDADVCG